MKLLQRANNKTYRKAISDEANGGRLPIARLIIGNIEGHGWGFLHPWDQIAVFPSKGTPGGFRDPMRHHERFWILRLSCRHMSLRHRNHDYDIEGRYWQGLVWRESMGPWWKPWRAKRKMLSPDIVTYDPQKADDWGDRPGEDW